MCVCGGEGSKIQVRLYGPSASAQQCCMHPLKVSSYSVELTVTLPNVPALKHTCVAVEHLCLLLNVPATLFIYALYTAFLVIH